MEKARPKRNFGPIIGDDEMNVNEENHGSFDKVFSPDLAGDEEGITVEQIALLTDFPEDFIKKELLIDGKEISMKEFRVKGSRVS